MGKFGLTKCRKWQGGVRTAFFSFLVKDHLGQLNRSINKGNVQGADVEKSGRHHLYSYTSLFYL